MRSPTHHVQRSATETDWLARFDHALQARRLAGSTVVRYQQVAAHFFVWWRTDRRRTDVETVAMSDVERFLRRHLGRCRCATQGRRGPSENRAALRHLWGVRPVMAPEPVRRSSVDAEVDRYVHHLRAVCGAAPATCVSRVRYVRAFLLGLFGSGVVDPRAITAAALRRFLVTRAHRCRPGSSGVIASALRSYMRYLALLGVPVEHLSHAVPAVARWRLATVPRSLTSEEQQCFRRAFRRRDLRGRRDHAMVHCLMDLGLRASEVAGLQLADVDWRAGTLRVRGTKTHRHRVLPMPAALGRALVGYLRLRPATSHRQLFVRIGVLHGDPVTASVVRSAVRLGYRRAGLPASYTGTHRLRHTVATALVVAGASLKEVADVLGHTCLDSTAIYAKVDLPRLRHVALPWEVA